MSANTEVRCVEVSFGDLVTTEDRLRGLRAAGTILNRLSLEWNYGETRPDGPPFKMVVYKDFVSDAAFDSALDELRGLEGVVDAERVSCESAYDDGMIAAAAGAAIAASGESA